MSIKVPEKKAIEQIQAGSYVARCYQMLHIGTIPSEWKGEAKLRNLVRITFELPSELKVFKEGQEPKPVAISAEYTLSLGEKSKLRPVLEGWRGKKFTEEEAKDFDVSKLLGVPAMIGVMHNEKGYAEIASISGLPKGVECPAQINPSQIFDYDENFDIELLEKLPEFIKKKIKSSIEYQKQMGTYQEEPEPLPSEEGEIDIKNIPF